MLSFVWQRCFEVTIHIIFAETTNAEIMIIIIKIKCHNSVVSKCDDSSV